MSTFRKIILATLSLAAIGMATATSSRQTGTGPIKVDGPTSVSSGGSYTYTITVGSTAAEPSARRDTVVSVGSIMGVLVPESSTVTVPAGSSTATVVVDVVGTPTEADTLYATNPNSTASTDVSVQ